ncbi:hypothetical protein GFV15_04695 [Lactococcus lactis]|uniref:hypothetical protein n=1 Tax=Lactococcus lactis TaxID=1358 RepID=UPI001292D2CD|nr:hypothetical protein [Lactococcus lactis]MQQ80262.1 hypothetical protein [Lactococcus lactis]
MNLKQVLELIADGNIVALKFKDSDEIMVKDYKNSDIFDDFMNCKVIEVNTAHVINEFEEEVMEMTVELEH